MVYIHKRFIDFAIVFLILQGMYTKKNNCFSATHSDLLIIDDYRFAVRHFKYHCANQTILSTTLSLYEPLDQPQIVKQKCQPKR